ncbi:hypothetical protein [Flavobacterium sp.]|uniref:hypothetical protein n=1 Tax=Flavobacterium sp. TaxID=239 RepID=UPI002B4B50C8|nr:hypothetical protein [Flavobacterium sp.]HLF52783.1 hypothetical protein [Flavobacterium sp.]
MKTDTFKGVIDVNEKGEAFMYGKNELMYLFKSNPGKRFYYTATTKRSSQQNRFMHKWIGLLADHIGEDFDKMKRDLKVKSGMLWEDHVNEETGECWKELRSTASLSVEENKKFLDWMQRFAAEFYRYELPNPGETQAIKFT